MIFQIREKFWSFGDDFSIEDDSGSKCFFVKGAVFSFGDHLSFRDENGQELAVIDQKLLSFMPTYEIIREGRPFATVKKEWSWFSKSFSLDVPGPNDYTIEGSFWEHDFSFIRGGRVVAEVSKTFFSMTDRYGVKIADGEDVVSILCTCIVIDQVLHDEKNK